MEGNEVVVSGDVELFEQPATPMSAAESRNNMDGIRMYFIKRKRSKL
jgi:hypothetical protein